MNERIKELANQAGCDYLYDYSADGHAMVCNMNDIEKFAELIVRECAKLNKEQSYELLGVIVDTDGGEYDPVCVNTVQRVHSYLATDSLLKHFGIEE
jgi:hypothetical protein